MVTDKIANLLNGLKTASVVNKEVAVVSYSKINIAILEALKKENFIEDFKILKDGIKKTVQVTLRYNDKKPAIHNLKRVSKQSCRIYSGAKKVRLVKSGYGSVFLTTSKGVITGKAAHKQNIGGEILFQIW